MTPAAVTVPEVAPPVAWSFPLPVTWQEDNGLTVHYYRLPGQHVLACRLGLPVPLSAEPADREGLALLLTRCLDEGTARRSAEDLAEELERRGIALGAGAGERGMVASLDVVGHHLGDALGLLTECLAEASYPEPEVARQVRTRLADIAHELADPAGRAALEFQRTYFDPADRASRPTGGSRETVAAITPDSVRDFHAQVVHPRGAVLVVAGDLPEAEVRALVGTTLGRWHGRAGAAEPAEPDPGSRAADAARVVVVDRPGSVQAQLHVGAAGPGRDHPLGWGVFQVLSFALGGSPTARVDRVLREQRGYTYGIRAGFRPRRRGGQFLASGAVRGESAVLALEELLSVLEVEPGDLTEEELRHSADFLARTAPGRYATADVVADEALGLAMEQLPLDFVTRTVEQVRSLETPVAREAWVAQRPCNWTVVLVGDLTDRVDELEALGRGPVQVVLAGQ